MFYGLLLWPFQNPSWEVKLRPIHAAPGVLYVHSLRLSRCGLT
jgi:hypothetical protein